MNEKLLIKTVALMVLEKIYLESDENFRATINAKDFVTEKISMLMIQKAIHYLKEKNYIQKDMGPYSKWAVTMTAAGVDWVEECYRVDPADNGC